MELNTDSCFFQGFSHKVCQDYSLAGTFGSAKRHYLIVSDGCSGSKGTDVGSRILAHCALNNIMTANGLPDYTTFGKRVIRDAAHVCTGVLGVSDEMLNATLLVCVEKEDGDFIAYIYGDGCVMQKHGDIYSLDVIEFSSGAPFYLSYWLDPTRRAAYDEKFGSAINAEVKWIMSEGDKVNAMSLEYDTSMEIDIPAENLDSIVLGTDGMMSFYQKIPTDQIKPIARFEQLLAFKNQNGEFLYRRAAKWLKELEQKEAWLHADDIGLAALTIKK